MTTLAIDTCFGACSVAVTWDEGGRTSGAYRCDALLRGHAERLVPMIGEAMAEAPFGIEALRRIIVTDGPGTFTGQRVGIAAARALALATGASVFTLSSLAVMAYGAGSLSQGVLAVAVDARRGEIYFQAFDGLSLRALGGPMLTTPVEAARTLGIVPALVVGSGAELVAGAASEKGQAVTAALPTLEPDVRFIPADAPLHAAPHARPLYLRPPDAKPQSGVTLRPS